VLGRRRRKPKLNAGEYEVKQWTSCWTHEAEKTTDAMA